MERKEVTKYGVALTLDTPMTDERRIDALEAKLGRDLPKDYREFLLSYNGGKPKPSAFQLAYRSGSDASSRVDWFLSLHDGPHCNLEKNIHSLKDRIPPDVLPIADDPFGNVVLLGLHGDVKGKIYFWDHENEPDSQPDWSNVELIADSFDSFMRGLKPSLNDR